MKLYQVHRSAVFMHALIHIVALPRSNRDHGSDKFRGRITRRDRNDSCPQHPIEEAIGDTS